MSREGDAFVSHDERAILLIATVLCLLWHQNLLFYMHVSIVSVLILKLNHTQDMLVVLVSLLHGRIPQCDYFWLAVTIWPFSLSFLFLGYMFHNAQLAKHRLLFDIRPTYACLWYLSLYRTIALLLPHVHTHRRVLFLSYINSSSYSIVL